MASFSASLKTPGDRTGLPATVVLEDNVLSIAAGDESLGEWPLSEIHLEPTPTGYRMAAEGDQILIEMTDAEAFGTELDRSTKSRRKLSRADRKAAKSQDKTTKTEPKPAEPEPTPDIPRRHASVPIPSSVTDTPTKKEKAKRARSDRPKGQGSKGEAIVGFVDKTIDAAEHRFGGLVPDWVFSRAMFWILFGALVLTVIFPGVVSILLLVLAALTIMAGAVLYTDPMMASKYLPGRMSPVHVLIIGVAVLLLGLLIGIIGS